MFLTVTHAIGFGLVTAAILAVPTVAVSLQYGVTSVPNFAQGDIMTLGAYAAYQTQVFTHNLVLEAIVATTVCALFALGMNYGLIQRFQKSGAKNIIILVVTAAVSLILENVIQAIWGGAPVDYGLTALRLNNYGPFEWSQRDILIMVGAVLVLASVHLVLRYTKFGKLSARSATALSWQGYRASTPIV